MTEQWDMFGIQSHVLLITNVTDVAAGVDPGDVLPVGSVFSISCARPGRLRHRAFRSARASGDLVSFKLLTPLGPSCFPRLGSQGTIAQTYRSSIPSCEP